MAARALVDIFQWTRQRHRETKGYKQAFNFRRTQRLITVYGHRKLGRSVEVSFPEKSPLMGPDRTRLKSWGESPKPPKLNQEAPGNNGPEFWVKFLAFVVRLSSCWRKASRGPTSVWRLYACSRRKPLTEVLETVNNELWLVDSNPTFGLSKLLTVIPYFKKSSLHPNHVFGPASHLAFWSPWSRRRADREGKQWQGSWPSGKWYVIPVYKRKLSLQFYCRLKSIYSLHVAECRVHG